MVTAHKMLNASYLSHNLARIIVNEFLAIDGLCYELASFKR